MTEARAILDQYLARTGLRHPSDAAQQYTVTLLRQWVAHLDEVLDANHLPPELRLTVVREFIYGAVPLDAEAGLRTAMHADMTYRAQRAVPPSPPVPPGGPS
jgi:hypothetical protein